jgi:hypothetical protein
MAPENKQFMIELLILLVGGIVVVAFLLGLAAIFEGKCLSYTSVNGVSVSIVNCES